MMFELKSQRVLLVMILIIFASSLKVKVGMRGFLKEKNKIEKKMNSMRLGNYLRRLMLKNNNLIDNKIVFLESSDFNIENEDINYTDMNTDGENDVDFKSRVYALKWIKNNVPKRNFKPFSVTPDVNENVKGWSIQNVLLLGDNDQSKVIKICFPNTLEENFAIVTLFNKKCKSKIKKINEYKMFDNFSYMNQGKPIVDEVDKTILPVPIPQVNKVDDMKLKQNQLIESSKAQHFKQLDLKEKVAMDKKEPMDSNKELPLKVEDDKFNIEDLK